MHTKVEERGSDGAQVSPPKTPHNLRIMSVFTVAIPLRFCARRWRETSHKSSDGIEGRVRYC